MVFVAIYAPLLWNFCRDLRTLFAFWMYGSLPILGAQSVRRVKPLLQYFDQANAFSAQLSGWSGVRYGGAPGPFFPLWSFVPWIMDYLNGAYFLFVNQVYLCVTWKVTLIARCVVCIIFRQLNSLFGNFEAFVQSLHFHPKQIVFIKRSRHPPATWLTAASACKCSWKRGSAPQIGRWSFGRSRCQTNCQVQRQRLLGCNQVWSFSAWTSWQTLPDHPNQDSPQVGGGQVDPGTSSPACGRKAKQGDKDWQTGVGRVKRLPMSSVGGDGRWLAPKPAEDAPQTSSSSLAGLRYQSWNLDVDAWIQSSTGESHAGGNCASLAYSLFASEQAAAVLAHAVSTLMALADLGVRPVAPLLLLLLLLEEVVEGGGCCHPGGQDHRRLQVGQRLH